MRTPVGVWFSHPNIFREEERNRECRRDIDYPDGSKLFGGVPLGGVGSVPLSAMLSRSGPPRDRDLVVFFRPGTRCHFFAFRFTGPFLRGAQIVFTFCMCCQAKVGLYGKYNGRKGNIYSSPALPLDSRLSVADMAPGGAVVGKRPFRRTQIRARTRA